MEAHRPMETGETVARDFKLIVNDEVRHSRKQAQRPAIAHWLIVTNPALISGSTVKVT
jgi:hypothetical protein